MIIILKNSKRPNMPDTGSGDASSLTSISFFHLGTVLQDTDG